MTFSIERITALLGKGIMFIGAIYLIVGLLIPSVGGMVTISVCKVFGPKFWSCWHDFHPFTDLFNWATPIAILLLLPQCLIYCSLKLFFPKS